VIDLGLRLPDVQAMNLASEPVDYRGEKDPRVNLRECGASEDECSFLVRRRTHGGWAGERVELNAMTSPQFIALLEEKLRAAGVAKLVPDQQTLDRAFRRNYREARVRQILNRVRKNVARTEPAAPADLAEGVRRLLEQEPTLSWDAAVSRLAAEQFRDEPRH